MSEIGTEEMPAPPLRAALEQIRRSLYETPDDETDLRVAIACVRTVVACLCGNVPQNHAAIFRGIAVLCTAVNLQQRLHGGNSGLEAALDDAARRVLASHGVERDS